MSKITKKTFWAGVLVGILGFAIYSIINSGAVELIGLGYYQSNLILIGVLIVVLWIMGYKTGVFKALKR